MASLFNPLNYVFHLYHASIYLLTVLKRKSVFNVFPPEAGDVAANVSAITSNARITLAHVSLGNTWETVISI